MKDVNILEIQNDTHDVVHLKTSKPSGISFVPGQAVDVSVNKKGWEKEVRPFTFTSLPEEDHLEFFIKTYPEHKGVTEQIGKLKSGDTLSIGEVFGDINYKGEGVFVAGGAGVTPFISIFRKMEKAGNVGNNKLIFANKKSEDIIAKSYFEQLLGKNFINVLSEEKKKGYAQGYISKELIKEHVDNISNTYFYLCGPPPMMDAALKIFKELGVDDKHIVKEEF